MEKVDYIDIIRTLAEHVEEGIHIVDSRGITITYSSKMAELEKTKKEEVLGKVFRDVFSYIPENQSTLLKALTQAQTTEEYQQTYKNKYGKEIITINTTFPVINAQDRVVAAIEISRDVTELKNMTHTILGLRGAVESNNKTPGPFLKKYTFDDLIGHNVIFLKSIEKAKKAAKNSAAVIISGETGTGKELFAQGIHYGSARKNKPFLAQNCAALPETLLEGILFGTSKGGFTGAVDRPGIFEQANGGTVLLDEISAMPYALQSKLLRVLQENYIRRVGGQKDIPIDVRVISTVNESINNLLEENRLRRDLYYRLNNLHIDIVPLRDRKDDIPDLVRYFTEKNAKDYNSRAEKISDKAMEALIDYDYPGNIRELENIIINALMQASSEKVIQLRHIYIDRSMSEIGVGDMGGICPENLYETFEEAEKRMIKKALYNQAGNVSGAAKILKVKRQTLQYKMKKYGIDNC